MDPLLKLGGPTSLSVLLRLQFSSACDSGGHHTLLAPTTSRILTQCFAPKKPMSRWLLSCLHLVIMPIPLILILLCSEADDLRQDTSSWLSPMHYGLSNVIIRDQKFAKVCKSKPLLLAHFWTKRAQFFFKRSKTGKILQQVFVAKFCQFVIF